MAASAVEWEGERIALVVVPENGTPYLVPPIVHAPRQPTGPMLERTHPFGLPKEAE